MSFKDQLKKDFGTLTLALMAVAIVLNIVLGQVVSLLKLPVFLDSIGSVLVGLLAGPWAGALTGLLTNLIWGLIIGLAAGLCAKWGLFRQWWQAVISGVIITVAVAIVAIPIRTYMFGGITGSGADFITAYLLATGQSLFGSVIVTVITSNIIDKVVTAVLAWGIVKGLPKRFTGRFPRAKSVTG